MCAVAAQDVSHAVPTSEELNVVVSVLLLGGLDELHVQAHQVQLGQEASAGRAAKASVPEHGRTSLKTEACHRVEALEVDRVQGGRDVNPEHSVEPRRRFNPGSEACCAWMKTDHSEGLPESYEGQRGCFQDARVSLG